MNSGLSRFGDALMAIGYYAERRNCGGCYLCTEDAARAYLRVGTIDPSGGRFESWVLLGFCPDDAESESRRVAVFDE
jgi:hypothetical protein